MGSNQTTVAVTGAAGAVATIVLLLASEFGWDVTSDQAVAIGGLIVTVATIIVGYLHKPKAAG